jgi:hypothetical protein
MEWKKNILLPFPALPGSSKKEKRHILPSLDYPEAER